MKAKTEKYWFLRIGNDALEEASRYDTKRDAVTAYKDVAKELAYYGQSIEASLHIAPTSDEVVEYPDYVLSLTEHGSVHIEQA